jgi:hypothetical protein
VAEYYKVRVSKGDDGVLKILAGVGVVALIALGSSLWDSPATSVLRSPGTPGAVQTTGAVAAAVVGANTYVQNVGDRNWSALWAAQTARYHAKGTRAATERWWGHEATHARIWPGHQPTVARTDSRHTWVLVPLEYVRGGRLVHQYVYWAFTKQGNQIDQDRLGGTCPSSAVSCAAIPLR